MYDKKIKNKIKQKKKIIFDSTAGRYADIFEKLGQDKTSTTPTQGVQSHKPPAKSSLPALPWEKGQKEFWVPFSQEDTLDEQLLWIAESVQSHFVVR